MKTLLTQASKILAGQWLSMPLSFVESILVARLLGAGALGEWALVMATFSICAVLVSFRTSESLTRHLVSANNENDDIQKVRLVGVSLVIELMTAIAISIIGIGIAFLSDYYIADSGSLNEGLVYVAAAIMLARAPNAVWITIERAKHSFWRIGFVPLIENLIRLPFVMLFVLASAQLDGKFGVTDVNLFLSIDTHNSQDYWLIVYAFICCCAAWVTTAVKVLSIRKWWKQHTFPMSISLFVEWRDPQLVSYWELMRAGFISGSLSGIVKNIDIMVLGMWASDSDVGVYRVAKNLSIAAQAAGSSISTASFQNISEYVLKNGIQETYRNLINTSKGLFPIIFIMYLSLFVLLWLFLPTLFGIEFMVARELLAIFLSGTLVSSSLFWIAPFMLAIKSARIYVMTTASTAIISMILMFILTPLWGSYGCATALASAWVIGHMLGWVGINRSHIV